MTALDALNRDCFCLSLDPAALAQALDVALGQPGLSAMVSERCPYLFSSQPVFVAAPQVQRMAQVVQAVEGVVLTPNPLCHALYADKRHLALFSDAARLQALDVPEATRQVLLAHAPTRAGQTLQVADWYVGLKNGVPDRLVNAQYSLLRVDDSGRFDLAASPSLQPPPAGAVAALEEDSWPTADQQAQMRRLTWGDPPRDPA